MINERTEEHLAGSHIKSAEDELSPRDGTRHDQEEAFPSRNQSPPYLDHLASDVATTTLHTLLNTVWEACTEASEPAADPETVRRLRVTSRRTLVALPSFRPYCRKQLFPLSNNTFVI